MIEALDPSTTNDFVGGSVVIQRTKYQLSSQGSGSAFIFHSQKMNTQKKIEAAEADEDAGTARLIAIAHKEIAAGIPLIPKKLVDLIADKLQRTGSSSIRHRRR